jgi:hypothetical protein
MLISVILPHYRTWKMSFYTIHQLLKCRGRHQLDIFVVDNNPSDGTAKNLEFFGDKIHLLPYPAGKMQSHGIAYDYAIPYLRTEVFATIESDSFPTNESGLWLDYIEQLVKQGYDSGGSCLDLSGGNFVHTAGAFYKKSIWQKAKQYVDNIEYMYLPNIAMKEKHACHLMVHRRVQQQFIEKAGDLVTLATEYQKETPQALTFYLGVKTGEYWPVRSSVFHNGMGNTDESFETYRFRNVVEERNNILQDNKKPLIWRMGMEPGQYFCYWMLANGHNVYHIQTETVWMPGREHQQQEKTVMQNGFTHLWAVTAYADATNPDLMDIIERKKNVMEELYNSIPERERPQN